MGHIGFFRNLRRQRVVKLEEDLDFGIKKTMRERWDFLTLIEFYQNLEELESLIRKSKILEEGSHLIKLFKILQKSKKITRLTKNLIFPIGTSLILSVNFFCFQEI